MLALVRLSEAIITNLCDKNSLKVGEAETMRAIAEKIRNNEDYLFGLVKQKAAKLHKIRSKVPETKKTINEVDQDKTIQVEKYTANISNQVKDWLKTFTLHFQNAKIVYSGVHKNEHLWSATCVFCSKEISIKLVGMKGSLYPKLWNYKRHYNNSHKDLLPCDRKRTSSNSSCDNNKKRMSLNETGENTDDMEATVTENLTDEFKIDEIQSVIEPLPAATTKSNENVTSVNQNEYKCQPVVSRVQQSRYKKRAETAADEMSEDDILDFSDSDTDKTWEQSKFDDNSGESEIGME